MTPRFARVQPLFFMLKEALAMNGAEEEFLLRLIAYQFLQLVLQLIMLQRYPKIVAVQQVTQ